MNICRVSRFAMLLAVLLQGIFAVEQDSLAVEQDSQHEEETNLRANRKLAGQICPSGWTMASGTVYDSWPKPGSEECIDYEGCKYAGQFLEIEGGSRRCCCQNGAKWLDGGIGNFGCRFPKSWVKDHRVAATWDQKPALKGKKIEVKIFNGIGSVTANVIDVCHDPDCDNCCSQNSSNGRYTLIDLEAQVACEMLGLNYNDPDFDVNNLDTPSNYRLYANRDTMPLCYRVIGTV